MKVWVYADTSKEIGDADHLKVFSSETVAENWLKANHPEGTAFGYLVAEGGKAERNERIKLDATFANNIAVGMVLGGVLLPTLSLYTNPFTTIDELFHAALSVPGVIKILGVVVALAAAIRMYKSARSDLDKLED
jgi:hypothetical protein